VTPLLLAPLDPLNVGPVSTPQAALRALPRDLRVGGFLDDLVLDGFPAHKGGALTRGDFNRVPVAVLTSAPPPRRERDGLPGRTAARDRPLRYGHQPPPMAGYRRSRRPDLGRCGGLWLQAWAAGARPWSAASRNVKRIVAMVDRPDYDDVAAALGMPRGSIGPTRGRCLSKLRAMLIADPSWST
jgi:hypothetical protein